MIQYGNDENLFKLFINAKKKIGDIEEFDGIEKFESDRKMDEWVHFSQRIRQAADWFCASVGCSSLFLYRDWVAGVPSWLSFLCRGWVAGIPNW